MEDFKELGKEEMIEIDGGGVTAFIYAMESSFII